jgi:hypothetical protein
LAFAHRFCRQCNTVIIHIAYWLAEKLEKIIGRSFFAENPMFRLFALIAVIFTVSINAEAYVLREAPAGDWVRWYESEIEIILDPSLREIGPMARVEYAVVEGFRLWRAQSTLPVRFKFRRAMCAESGDDRQNCVMTCSKLENCRHFGRSRGATTQLRYSRRGQILGADIVLNTRDWQWKLKRDGQDGLDLRFVIAHETGHFLGIRHSREPSALMFATMLVKDSRPLRLARDDRAAVRALYGTVSRSRSGRLFGGVWQREHHPIVEKGLFIIYMFLSLVSMVLYRRDTNHGP